MRGKWQRRLLACSPTETKQHVWHGPPVKPLRGNFPRTTWLTPRFSFTSNSPRNQEDLHLRVAHSAEKARAPSFPFPRDARRSGLQIICCASFILPSRVPPILAAVSLRRPGCRLPTGRPALGT